VATALRICALGAIQTVGALVSSAAMQDFTKVIDQQPLRLSVEFGALLMNATHLR
jgi:hypothetical protein